MYSKFVWYAYKFIMTQCKIPKGNGRLPKNTIKVGVQISRAIHYHNVSSSLNRDFVPVPTRAGSVLISLYFKKFDILILLPLSQSAQFLSIRFWCKISGVRYLGRSNRHIVANSPPPLRCFFGAMLPRCKAAVMGPANCYRFGVIPRI